MTTKTSANYLKSMKSFGSWATRYSRAGRVGIAFGATLLIVNSADAATDSWQGASGADWGTPSSWNPSAVPASGDTALFNTGAGTSITVANAIANQSINSISFDTSAGSYTIGATGGDSLTLGSGGTTQILSTLTSTNAVETINAPIILGGSYTFANYSASGTGAGAGTLNFGGSITSAASSGITTLTLNGNNTNANTISGAISNGTGTNKVALTISTGTTTANQGTWVLSGNNTFAGGVTVGEFGTLDINAAGTSSTNSAIGTGTLTITSGGTINNTSGSPITLTTGNAISLSNFTFGGSNNLDFASGNVALTNSNTVTMNGTNKTLTFGGTVDPTNSSGTNNSLTVNNGAGGSGNTLVIGTYVFGNQSKAQAALFGGTANITITGELQQNFAGNNVGYSGTGTLTLESSLSNYTGATTISSTGATLVLGASTVTSGSVGSETLVSGPIGTGTLILQGATTTIDDNGSNITLANSVSGASTLILGSTGSGSITFDGTGLATPATFVMNANNNLVLTVNNTTTIKDVISGGAGRTLTENGTGTLVLSGANTYTGATTVSQGTLVAGVNAPAGTAGAFGNQSSAVTLGSSSLTGNASLLAASGVTVGLGITEVASAANSSLTIGSISGGTATYTGAIVVKDATTLVAGTGGETDFITGAWTTNNNVINVGTSGNTGNVQLDNAVNTTGGINLNFGTLTVNSNSSSSAVKIASGTTLKGVGTTGAVTLNSGGAINLVDGVIGKLTIGSLTTTGGGSLTFEIGGGTTNTDEIADTGGLSASGSTTINMANLGGVGQTLTTGTYTILAYTGAQQSLSDFSLSTGTLDGKTLTLGQTAGTDAIYVVVSNSSSVTSTTYSLSVAAGSTLLHQGATTSLTTTIQNTGTSTSDSLAYSGLGATATNGTSYGASSGTLTPGTSGSATGTYTATTAGTDTVTPTASSATNATLGGNATQAGTTTATITVYSGQSVWAGTGASGTWGTLTSNFGTNWGANQGSPGLDPGFTDTDSATFNTVAGQSAVSVTLDGASPSLNAITFDSSTTSFTLAQGTGTGSITLNGGSSNATVTDTLGTHTISAPVNLATSANVNVASGQQLTISGTISGVGGLFNTGSGTTVISGSNNYSGGTTVSSGTLELNNGNVGSATGSGALSVGAGAVLAGIGSSSGSSFNVTGTSNSAVATVLVGHNSATDLNTTGVMSLQATGASSIGAANLVFNLSATSAGVGNQLSVGATAIAFNTVSSMSTTLTLNLQGSHIIASGTTYVLIAGTTASGGSGQLGSQYTGLDLGTSMSLGSGITETKILNSEFGGTGSLNLSFGSSSSNSFYGSNSFLFLYQNANTGVDDIEVDVVPEPSTWAMMLGGLALLVFIQRRRNISGGAAI